MIIISGKDLESLTIQEIKDKYKGQTDKPSKFNCNRPQLPNTRKKRQSKRIYISVEDLENLDRYQIALKYFVSEQTAYLRKKELGFVKKEATEKRINEAKIYK